MERLSTGDQRQKRIGIGKRIVKMLHAHNIGDTSKEKPQGVEVDDFTWDRMTRSEREIMHSFAKVNPNAHKSVQLRLVEDRRTGQRTYNPNLSPEERLKAGQFMDEAAAEIDIVDASPDYSDLHEMQAPNEA